MLATVLLRSGSVPLDIKMTANHSFIHLSDIVLPQAGRIFRLILQVYPGGLYPFLSELSVLRRRLSSLTEAALFANDLEIPSDDASGIHIFGNSPLLRKLEINLCHSQSELLKALCDLHIPFSQLTELILDVHSSPHIMFCILKDTC